MVANYQSGPAIYKYLKDNKGVKTVAFVAANESDPLSQRDGGVEAAKALGLEVVAVRTSPTRTTPRDFTPVLSPIVSPSPTFSSFPAWRLPTRRCSSAPRANSAMRA